MTLPGKSKTITIEPIKTTPAPEPVKIPVPVKVPDKEKVPA